MSRLFIFQTRGRVAPPDGALYVEGAVVLRGTRVRYRARARRFYKNEVWVCIPHPAPPPTSYPNTTCCEWATSSYGFELILEPMWDAPDRTYAVWADVGGGFAATLNEADLRRVAQSVITRVIRALATPSVPSESDGARPKGTDEVAPASTCTSNDVHGGSGASGEVPDGQSASGSAGRAAQSPAEAGNDLSPSSNEDGEVGRYPGLEWDPADPGSDPRDGSAGRAGSRSGSHDGVDGKAPDPAAVGSGEGTGGLAGRGDTSCDGQDASAVELATSPDEGDVPSAGGPDAEGVGSAIEILRRLRRRRAGRGPSRGPVLAFGGVYARLARGARPEPALIRRALRALSLLVHQRGEGEPSPRWDARELAMKIAGFLRLPTEHDRRMEAGRPTILLLVDVSGSMSAFAAEVIRLAANLPAVPDWQIAAVVHSNGFPVQLVEPGRPPRDLAFDEIHGDGYAPVFRFYEDFLRRHDVPVVVAAGDTDAAWLYAWFTRRPETELFWLDVYASSHGRIQTRIPRAYDEIVTPRGSEWVPGGFNLRVLHFAHGCRHAEDFVAALEELIRLRSRRGA